MTTAAKNVQPPSPSFTFLRSAGQGAVIAVEDLKEVLRHQRWLAPYLSSNQFGDSPIFLFYESNMSFLERRMRHGVINLVQVQVSRRHCTYGTTVCGPFLS